MRLLLSENIIERLRQRDEAAFAELLETASPQLIAFSMSYGLGQDEAEDVIQTVLVHMWQLGERLTPAGSLESYLFAAARNETLKHLRNVGIRERHVQRYANDISIQDDDYLDPAHNPLSGDLTIIRHCLTRLTEHQRTAFKLRYEQQMTVGEVAHVLGISHKGAERLLTRVNALIRECFSRRQVR